MDIFRITLSPYAGSLQASGRPARWNGKGMFMVYTAGSVALACLENLAHRSGVDFSAVSYAVTVLHIPDKLPIESYSDDELEKLHPEWFHIKQYPVTQEIGDRWLRNNASAVLSVPSAIIRNEYNYLINPRHPDSTKIKVSSVMPFTFDNRLL